MKPNLTLVSNLTSQERYFLSLIADKRSVAALTRVGNWQFVSKLASADINTKTFYLETPPGLSYEFLEGKIEQSKNENFLATIKMPGKILGLNFKILQVNVQGLLCEFPNNFYEINRRAVPRWDIPPELANDVYVEFLIPLVSPTSLVLPVLDLSTMGLSFKVPKGLVDFFKVNQIFPKVNLGLNNRVIPMSFEIRNILNNNEPRFPKKSGVKFIKASDLTQMEIAKFIQNCKKTGS